MKAAVLTAVGAPLVVVLTLAASGRISVTRPITRRYRLDQADEAYRALDRGEIAGRAIVVMD